MKKLNKRIFEKIEKLKLISTYARNYCLKYSYLLQDFFNISFSISAYRNVYPNWLCLGTHFIKIITDIFIYKMKYEDTTK